jgi:uncharacterized glyoxalase superfamily protein PhnB
MADASVTLGNLVPYLFYDDIEAMLDWYARVFGFVERSRWQEDGRIHNAEMLVGDTELWLDGATGRDRAMPGQWVGVWVDDPDAMAERVAAQGVEIDSLEDKPYGVRMLTVKDPEGHSWGFMRRIP